MQSIVFGRVLLITMVLVLLNITMPRILHAQNPENCDESNVTINETLVIITPNGADDTANIQCALDTAVTKKIARVQMTGGDFSISRISVDSFSGTFGGISRNDTSVSVIAGSIDCQAMIAAGQVPAVLKFNQGSPKLNAIICGALARAQAADRQLVTLLEARDGAFDDSVELRRGPEEESSTDGAAGDLYEVIVGG